jgi:hypothetical protein
MPRWKLQFQPEPQRDVLPSRWRCPMALSEAINNGRAFPHTCSSFGMNSTALQGGRIGEGAPLQTWSVPREILVTFYNKVP